MKYATLRAWALAGFFGLFCALHAQPRMHWTFDAPPPLHPTIIEGDFEGETLPIVAVSRDTPEIEKDGKLKRLSLHKAHFTPTRGATFAEGSIQLRNVQANSSKTNLRLMFEHGGDVDAGTISASSDFSAQVESTADYSDCFVALIFFDQDYLEGKSDNPNATVQFKSIKPLHKGTNKVELSFGYMDFGKHPMGFFPLFFTRGLEIRSDQCEFTARFFRHREELIHRALLKQYLEKHAGESKPIQAYMKIPPVFPDGMQEEKLPEKVTVSFMVSEEGRVESLQLPSDLPTNIYRLLSRTINGWLFLPRLKAGRPERTMVTLPLILRAEEPAQEPAKSSS